MGMMDTDEKRKAFLNTNRRIARAMCGEDAAIVDGSSSGVM